MHPTVKPVALVADAMRDCSSKGDIVLDPFLGSGTTLMAAEKIGRRCFGLEYEPAFVDVAVRRWQAYTKVDAILDGDGRTFDEIAEERLKAMSALASSVAGPTAPVKPPARMASRSATRHSPATPASRRRSHEQIRSVPPAQWRIFRRLRPSSATHAVSARPQRQSERPAKRIEELQHGLRRRTGAARHPHRERQAQENAERAGVGEAVHQQGSGQRPESDGDGLRSDSAQRRLRKGACGRRRGRSPREQAASWKTLSVASDWPRKRRRRRRRRRITGEAPK